MLKLSSRSRRQAAPARVSPLIAGYVAALNPQQSAATSRTVQRTLLLSKTWHGVTVNRYADGYEIIFSDGRRISAASPWALVVSMFKGAAK